MWVRWIKVPCRADQPEVSFLDQVVQGDPALFVVADGAEHQPQVRRDELLPGVHVARLDSLGQCALIAGREPVLTMLMRGRRGMSPWAPNPCAFDKAAPMTSPWSLAAILLRIRVEGPVKTRWFADGLEFQSAIRIHGCSFERPQRPARRAATAARQSESQHCAVPFLHPSWDVSTTTPRDGRCGTGKQTAANTPRTAHLLPDQAPGAIRRALSVRHGTGALVSQRPDVT